MSGASAWERIWTPHRMEYIKGDGKPCDDEPDECPFCREGGTLSTSEGDSDDLVVFRGDTCYVVLNKYPYNSGHLLVCPYRHVAQYTELDEAEVLEFGKLTQEAMTTLKRTSGAHGFNIGMNQGSIAGAGIAAHLHQHVIPRWNGDTNFMPVVGGVKVLPQLLEQTRGLLTDNWAEDAC